MNRTISRDALWTKIQRGDRFFLFEVLAPMYWRKHHLPGALNMPPDKVRETIEATVPDLEAEIVLYCWDDDCPTSPWAKPVLEPAGKSHVIEYPGGKKEWQDAGLPMEKPPRRPTG